MISPKAAEAAGASFGTHPVCAGPYAFEQRVPQDRIVLRRYAGYWNPNEYHFDQVVYLPSPNSSVRLANLQAGSLDLVEYILPTDIPAVEADPKLRIAAGDALGYVGVTFNVNNGPAAKTVSGQNALVRQAFELAIDKQALIQVVYNGLFKPTAQANSASSPLYVPQIQSPPRDVARAQALLKQAGVSLPVKIVLTATNGPDIQQAAEVIQSMTREAGFDVSIRTMEFASSLQAAYGGDFEAYLIGWSGRSDADGNMWQMLHTGGTFNYGHYSDRQMDAWLDEARVPTSAEERRAIYAKVWGQARRDMPLVYLWNPQNIVGLKRSLTGFEQVPDGLIRLRGMAFSN
jgi:peptide/nickel transport system substrate-binding protein